MLEAKITCKCTGLAIPDLGLALAQGDEVWVPSHKAKLSRDLAQAIQVGGVQVQYRERVQELRQMTERKPQPPWKTSVAIIPPAVIPPAPIPSATISEVTIAPAALEAAVDAAVAKAMPTVIEGIRVALQQHIGTPADPAAIAAAVTKALGSLGVVPSGKVQTPGVATIPEPVFVPKGVVPTNTAAVRTKDTTQGGDALTDAAAALKAVGKPKQRRKKVEKS